MSSHQLTMTRPNLAGIPQHPVPAGYAIRGWQPGDRETWVRIHARAEKLVCATAEVYDREFGGNAVELARRQLFLVDCKGRAIGTGTAWFEGDRGRVHWLAIAPKYQGRGLGRALLSAVCNRLAELGHKRVYLTTDRRRVGAVELYRSFGFVEQRGRD